MLFSLSSLWLASLPVVVALGFSTAHVVVAEAAAESVAPEPVPSPPSSPEARAHASTAPLATAPLELEGTWQATAFDALGAGLVEPPSDTRPAVTFLDDARLEGTTACGGYIGSWSSDGERLRMGILTTGTSPCDQARRDEEIAFTQALTAVSSWAATSSGLELRDPARTVRVVLEHPPDASILGEWNVRRYARADGRLRDPLEGSRLSVDFRPGELVEGSTGCRLFKGGYFTEADRVVIGPLQREGLPCEGAFRHQERRYLRALANAVTWQREGRELVLLDSAGRAIVQLVERPT